MAGRQPLPTWRWTTRALRVGAAVALAGLVASGCVGRYSRNDDRVGPYSYRPDAREHT